MNTLKVYRYFVDTCRSGLQHSHMLESREEPRVVRRKRRGCLRLRSTDNPHQCTPVCMASRMTTTYFLQQELRLTPRRAELSACTTRILSATFVAKNVLFALLYKLANREFTWTSRDAQYMLVHPRFQLRFLALHLTLRKARHTTSALKCGIDSTSYSCLEPTPM